MQLLQICTYSKFRNVWKASYLGLGVIACVVLPDIDLANKAMAAITAADGNTARIAETRIWTPQKVWKTH